MTLVLVLPGIWHNGTVMTCCARVVGVVGVLVVLLVGTAGAASPEPVDEGSPTALRSLVTRVSREQGVDPRLVHALVQVESDFDPQAVSRRGALGLMQLMPETARRLDVSDPFDPEENVRAGVRELSRLIDRYAGDLPRALAAYNAGEGAVASYRGVPPYRETRSYVSRIMTLYTGRPYHLPEVAHRRPVLLLRQPGSGQVVITNAALPGGTVTGPTSRGLSSHLSGGFGK